MHCFLRFKRISRHGCTEIPKAMKRGLQGRILMLVAMCGLAQALCDGCSNQMFFSQTSLANEIVFMQKEYLSAG